MAQLGENDILSSREVRLLIAPSDLRGWSAVLFTWAVVAASLYLAGQFPHPLVILVAMLIIGGRQLAMAIIVHETVHRSLFKTRWLNEVTGRWICGGPIWQDLPRYREEHLRHHRYAGSEKDPDLGLISHFPISKSSLTRKLIRDLNGLTALKRMYGLLLMDLGFITFTASTGTMPIPQKGRKLRSILKMGIKNMAPVLVSNGALLALLTVTGKPWLYLIWFGAYCTFFSAFIRIRSIAEHACTEASLDPLKSTRTTYANFLARMTVAPHRVNFHLEHHLLPLVPYYNLPRLHQLLKGKQIYGSAHIASGYGEVLNRAVK